MGHDTTESYIGRLLFFLQPHLVLIQNSRQVLFEILLAILSLVQQLQLQSSLYAFLDKEVINMLCVALFIMALVWAVTALSCALCNVMFDAADEYMDGR
jgi:hypothetical protein